MKPIILGVPSGSLQSNTLRLLAKSGIIRTAETWRSYELKTEYENLVLRILDRRGMPCEIRDGVADFGITGSDYALESGVRNLQELGTLTYSRRTDQPTRLVLAWPAGAFASTEAVKNTPIYTELPRLTRQKLREVCGFERKDIILRQTYGKTETAGAFRNAAFTDITETGDTLRANGMTILATLFTSSPTLYARPESYRDAGVRQVMEDISRILMATLEQERNPQVMAEMNVPTWQLESVCKMLPANTSPTILHTRDDDWSVVKVLIPRTKLINLSGDLSRLGVQWIVTTEPSSVL